MIISTPSTTAKFYATAQLARSSETVCIRETWGLIEDTDIWEAFNEVSVYEYGQTRRSCEVAVLN